MSTVAEEVEAPPPPTSEVIMQPAKSEDKLEIEREEKEKEEEKGNEDGKDGKEAEGAEDEKKDEEVSNVHLLAICAPFTLGFPHPTMYVTSRPTSPKCYFLWIILGCSHNCVFTIYRKRRTTRRRRTRGSPRRQGAAAAARESSN